MSYLSSNLLEQENILQREKMHWGYLFLPAINGLICITLLIYSYQNSSYIMAFICFVGFLLLTLKPIESYVSTEFGITNRRVVSKLGLITRDTSEIYLDKIESSDIKQGILGRIFNFGDVVIAGSGGNEVRFKGVGKPMELKKKIQELKAA